MDKKGNNEGERATREYVDTTLRTSHYKQSEDTNKRVRGILTLKQAIVLSALQWVLCASVTAWYNGVWFFEVRDNLEKETRRADIAESQNNWLWHSHSKLCALLEDDPKLLTLADWEFFLEKGTTRRIDGFLKIMHDGDHPNLDKWHLELQNKKSNQGLPAAN
jgi:hypothetical protein